MLNVPWLPDADVPTFPDVAKALSEPDGLLAVGGNLSVKTLLNAYSKGIFPWFAEEQPILWWSPSVRAIIVPSAIHVSKNMQKMLRRQAYCLAADTAFADVVMQCSAREQTWITDDMRVAYGELHRGGMAHSVEVYDQSKRLIGGLYGVFVGNCFCGESMFSHRDNASKLALIALAQFLQRYGCELIDCQLPTKHLQSMGAQSVSRADFVEKLDKMRNNRYLLNRRWTDLWQLC